MSSEYYFELHAKSNPTSQIIARFNRYPSAEILMYYTGLDADDVIYMQDLSAQLGEYAINSADFCIVTRMFNPHE